MANLNTSYTIAQQHMVHVVSASFFNLGDRLYRNHLSFIKDLAPEIGRVCVLRIRFASSRLWAIDCWEGTPGDSYSV